MEFETDKLKKLKAQRAAIDARLRQEQYKLNKQERARDTQRKILVGAAMMKWARRSNENSLTLDTELKNFLTRNRLRKIAEVHRQDGGRYQPRLHDLRHSFAVHRLVGWYRTGADVNLMLPKLSTYLGHLQMSHTQKYLTMTPELLQQASLRFEAFVGVEVVVD